VLEIVSQGAPENQDKKHWIEIQLNDDDGNPIPEPYKERCRMVAPD
jgi:hypothetical protein